MCNAEAQRNSKDRQDALLSVHSKRLEAVLGINNEIAEILNATDDGVEPHASCNDAGSKRAGSHRRQRNRQRKQLTIRLAAVK